MDLVNLIDHLGLCIANAQLGIETLLDGHKDILVNSRA
jgi:hypothetical protein